MEILQENNIPKEFLEPYYECKICNDTGYVLDNNYKTTMCNCLKQKLLNISFNKSNIYNIKKENFNNFNELIFLVDYMLQMCLYFLLMEILTHTQLMENHLQKQQYPVF